jgi:hypothetical protein
MSAAGSEPLSEHLEPLRPLLGAWTSSGTLLRGPDDAPAAFAGHDVWAVLPGGRWLSHHWEATVGTRVHHLHQVIGGTHPEGGWQLLAFEDAPVPELTRLSQEGPRTLVVHGDGLRASHELPDPEGPPEMHAHWERTFEGRWTTWLRLRYVPVDA